MKPQSISITSSKGRRLVEKGVPHAKEVDISSSSATARALG